MTEGGLRAFSPTFTDWLTGLGLALLLIFVQRLTLLVLDNDPTLPRIPFLFFFAGSILLAPLVFILFVLFFHVIQWLAERWIDRPARPLARPSNDASELHLLPGLGAHWAYLTLAGGLAGPVLDAVALLAAVIAYLIIYLALLPIFQRVLYPTPEEGQPKPEERALNASHLIAGALLIWLWNVSPWLMIPAFAQLLLIYRALQASLLVRQARTDEKTGLWNVRYFNQSLEAELKRSVRHNRPLALIIGDLDLLRNINNTYGHLAGDMVLIGISRVITGSVRKYDTAGRFGGEEFAILLPETPPGEAVLIAERLRQSIENARLPIGPAKPPIQVTMSIGVACFPGDATGPVELLQAADVAMYEAKRRGRNQVVAVAEMPRARRESGKAAQLESLAARLSFSNRVKHLQWDRSPLLEGAISRYVSVAGLLIRRAQPVLIAFAVAAGVLLALLTASRDALPGQVLYPVKQTYEVVQVALAVTPGRKAALYLAFAQTRISEIQALAASGDYESVHKTIKAYEQELISANESLNTAGDENAVEVVLVGSQAVDTLQRSEAVLHALVRSSPAVAAPLESAAATTQAAVATIRTRVMLATNRLTRVTTTPASRQSSPSTVAPASGASEANPSPLGAGDDNATSPTPLVTGSPTPTVAAAVPTPSTQPEPISPTSSLTDQEATATFVPATSYGTVATPFPSVATGTPQPSGTLQRTFPTIATGTIEPSFPTITAPSATPSEYPTVPPDTVVPPPPPTASAAPSATMAATRTPSQIPTNLPSPTATRTGVPTRTLDPTLTPTPLPTSTWTLAPTPAPSETPIPTNTIVPTQTATRTLEPSSGTPTPTHTLEPPSDTPSPTYTLQPPSDTPRPSDTLEPPSDTPSPTYTLQPPSDTPTATWTPEPPTDTPTATWTSEPTEEPTPEPSATELPTLESPSETPIATLTVEPTDAPTDEPTDEPTAEEIPTQEEASEAPTATLTAQPTVPLPAEQTPLPTETATE